MAGYKDRRDSFNSGGKKMPLRTVLTVIGSGEPLQMNRPKKTGFVGYQ